MKKSQLKEAIKAEIKSVLLEEEEKFQMTYKGDPVDLKISKFGGNAEGARDTVLFVNVGGIGKRRSKASKNALEKRKELLNQKVDKIMFTNKDNISKEIKDISPSDFKITSVLSEQSNNPDFDKKVASFAKKINNEMDYPGGVLEAMKQIKSRLERIISKVEDAKRGGAEEEPLMKMIGLKEVYQTNSKMSQIVSLFQDMMDDEYDGMDYRKALNDVLKAIDDDYKSAEREGEKFSRIREDDEPTAADLKKKDSVATTSNKLQKLTAKMKKKAKEFKEAEGKAKDKIKDELKDMTAEKKKLEKDL